MNTVTLTVEMTTEAMPIMVTITVRHVQRAIVTQSSDKGSDKDTKQ